MDNVSKSSVFSPSTLGVNPPSAFAGRLFLFAQIYYLTVNPRGGELMSRIMRRGTNVFKCLFQFRDPIITNTINVGYTH